MAWELIASFTALSWKKFWHLLPPLHFLSIPEIQKDHTPPKGSSQTPVKTSDTLLLAQQGSPMLFPFSSGDFQGIKWNFRLFWHRQTRSCKQFMQAEYQSCFTKIFIIQHYKPETEVRGSCKVTQETCSSAGNKNMGLLTAVTNKIIPVCNNKRYSAKCLSFHFSDRTRVFFLQKFIIIIIIIIITLSFKDIYLEFFLKGKSHLWVIFLLP